MARHAAGRAWAAIALGGNIQGVNRWPQESRIQIGPNTARRIRVYSGSRSCLNANPP
jgi:hypothetical protein